MRRAMLLAGVLRSARALAPVIRRQRPLTVARHMPTTQEEIEAAKLPTNADEEMVKLRHSASHVMALAVKNVFKDEVQVTIGPWIENGAISASRRVETPSRHRRASSPGGLVFDLEAIRTALRDRDAPRRCSRAEGAAPRAEVARASGYDRPKYCC